MRERTLSLLARLHRNRRDQLRGLLLALEDQRSRIHQRLEALPALRRHELARADTAAWLARYGEFLEGSRLREQALRRERLRLEQAAAELRSRLLEARVEMERHERLLARIQQRRQAARARAWSRELEELVQQRAAYHPTAPRDRA